jgi:hypothetical protein
MNRGKEKLNRLIEEAMEKGTSPDESKEILEQSRKVDELINQYQKKKRDEPIR